MAGDGQWGWQIIEIVGLSWLVVVEIVNRDGSLTVVSGGGDGSRKHVVRVEDLQ